MDNTYGPTCLQVDTRPKCTVPTPTIEASEDCLFLDVYVPQAVWDQGQSGIANTPVVVWFYGGAYEFGAKSTYGTNLPFYKGDGLIDAAANMSSNFIFVAGNYRLGALGWLSGPTIETRARTNAGLYDQRLLLQWVQDFIHLFGGDKGQVSAWGESAGAGSIMHHLIANFNGSRDPLFQRAFLQSPAFQWQWDRSQNGTLEQVYLNFTIEAKCDGTPDPFECLVEAPTETLMEANQNLWDEFTAVGLFQLGPAIDNDTFQELPAIAYDNGNVWKGLKSLAISHVSHEADSFTPKWVQDEAGFESFLNQFIRESSLEPVRQAIKAQYPASNYGGSQQDRLRAVIGDSTFYCNTRQMFNAYQSSIPVYMMIYDFFGSAAKHATDLLPTFWTPTFGVEDFLLTYFCDIPAWKVGFFAGAVNDLAPLYQGYLADFAVSGNPSTHPHDSVWNTATLTGNGDKIEAFRVQVMPYFDAISPDEQNTQAICSFWTDVSINITNIMNGAEMVSEPIGYHGILQKPIYQEEL
ncbi:Alpha/Beta hydrolase protein [Xylariaceae sp. FL0662B]|nr:Alpha/Beta hydrolase protein [Xylariaceae sp. FL0662B]